MLSLEFFTNDKRFFLFTLVAKISGPPVIVGGLMFKWVYYKACFSSDKISLNLYSS